VTGWLLRSLRSHANTPHRRGSTRDGNRQEVRRGSWEAVAAKQKHVDKSRADNEPGRVRAEGVLSVPVAKIIKDLLKRRFFGNPSVKMRYQPRPAARRVGDFYGRHRE
jgi:hypothetical protein